MKDGHDKENNGLEEELESLYQKVARNDQVDGNVVTREDLTPCYAALQVKPDASLAEIAESYEKLKDTWREDRFVNVASWQDKSQEKLKEIKTAYEKILSLRLYESKSEHRESSSGDQVDIFLSRESEEVTEGDEPPPGIAKQATPYRTRGYIVGAVVVISIALAAIFIWPTLYHYEALKTGDKVFPLRINRMTSETTYFNGQGWVSPPIVAIDQTVRKPKLPVSSVSPEDKAPASQATAPQMIEKQASHPQPRKEKDVKALLPKKSAAAESSLNLRKSAPAAPSLQKKSVQSTASSKIKAGKGVGFSIQIKAFRNEEKAKAFIGELKMEKSEIFIEKVIDKDKISWYRVLVGHFSNKNQALKYLKGNKAFDAHPGSFVQSAGQAS